MAEEPYKSKYTGAQVDDLLDKVDNLPENIVSDVVYDQVNRKFTRSVNGATSDVTSASQIVQDGGGASVTFRVW